MPVDGTDANNSSPEQIESSSSKQASYSVNARIDDEQKTATESVRFLPISPCDSQNAEEVPSTSRSASKRKNNRKPKKERTETQQSETAKGKEKADQPDLIDKFLEISSRMSENAKKIEKDRVEMETLVQKIKDLYKGDQTEVANQNAPVAQRESTAPERRVRPEEPRQEQERHPLTEEELERRQKKRDEINRKINLAISKYTGFVDLEVAAEIQRGLRRSSDADRQAYYQVRRSFPYWDGRYNVLLQGTFKPQATILKPSESVSVYGGESFEKGMEDLQEGETKYIVFEKIRRHEWTDARDAVTRLECELRQLVYRTRIIKDEPELAISDIVGFAGFICSTAVEVFERSIIKRITQDERANLKCLKELLENGKLIYCSYYAGSDNSNDLIHISHDNKIKVSQSEASRIQKESLNSLKNSNKLILIIDLDQTLVHATVDQSVHSWKHAYPDHPVVGEIYSFILKDSPQFAYFIKLRPFTRLFLEKLAELYELHIYTMGSRNYADAVAKIIDPNGSLFQERILSRDESGSFTTKNIARLFPQDQSMVVVLDDRADVWKYSPNLIRIMPYNYFIGTGDINKPMIEGPRQIEVAFGNIDVEKPNEPYYLKDTDRQLEILLPILIDIHLRYFKTQKSDVRQIIPDMKSQVLNPLSLCFSSLFPMNTDPEDYDIWQMAKSFGAECTVELTMRNTHLVTGKKGTRKCMDARKMKSVNIVGAKWLWDSVFEWSRKDEKDYLLYPVYEGEDDEENDLIAYSSTEEIGEPVLMRIGEDEWDEIEKELEEISDDGEEDTDEQNDQSDEWDSFSKELEEELSEPAPKRSKHS